MALTKHPLVVLATPDALPEQVDRARWPVHVTVAGNFRVEDAAVGDIVPIVADATASVPSFDVRLGPSARFGADGSVPVLLASHPSFVALHAALATELEKVQGFTPVEPAYRRDGYRPHATLGRAVHVREGDDLTIRTIGLFSLEGSIGLRLASFALGRS
ncbi:2'-5' RNA ligase family protein [Humibacter ginsenosidimutans]|uniref:2'-5' RNA ligase family protein n=1 Tax=Humibacter ginsenosidimutans TaxID=2599293 RepID=A0A5B8M659_9MICO|nr:2'-5' RNA ligase family protein [Humibacter ginsenosidimutans]QDZ15464.1 2'-5' RNA ligase family protein [Humibacter ginsenosidimutans]